MCDPDSVPFYNPNLSYQENYEQGPFGLFATDPPALERRFVTGAPESGGVAPERFLGVPLTVPFGIPAGPLLNAAYVAAAFRWGYDLCHSRQIHSQPGPRTHSPTCCEWSRMRPGAIFTPQTLLR